MFRVSLCSLHCYSTKLDAGFFQHLELLSDNIKNAQNSNLIPQLGINEIEPYQALDVMRDGSFRGVPKSLVRFTYGDVYSDPTKSEFKLNGGILV